MSVTAPHRPRPAQRRRGWAAPLQDAGRLVFAGAELLALVLSPSSYARRYRPDLARQIVLDTTSHLLWFTLLSALISLVLIRIVVVTAFSYGLSQFAVQMVVRVLVLELIPTTAALFVALRSTIPRGAELAELRRAERRRHDDPPRPLPVRAEALHRHVVPRAVAGIFAVWTLVAVSSVMALVVGYLVVHGFAIGGLETYTRTVGQVFEPDVSVIFLLKTLFLSVAVGVVPMAWAWFGAPARGTAVSGELQLLVRLFVVILLIEIVSLMGNYY